MRRKALVVISLVLLVVMCFTLPVFAIKAVAIKAIKLGSSTLTLEVGQTYQLKAALTPANATMLYSWLTSNKGIVTIDSKGNVKAVNVGKATITAKSADGKVTAKCSVTINKKSPPMTIKVWSPGKSIGNAQNLVDQIGKLSNTKPIFMETSWTDWMNKVSLIITTGEDVQWVNADASQPYNQWGEDGFLWDLAPILQAHKDELPVLNSIAFSDIFKPHRGNNGEVYGIPALSYLNNNGIRMRGDILKKLGIATPTSTDEIYKALKKIKEANVLAQGGYPILSGGLSRFYWAFLAYGGELYQSTTELPRYYKDGNLFKPYDISNMNKEALKYVRKLHQEGLVNPDWPSPPQGNLEQDGLTQGLSAFFFGSEGFEKAIYGVHPEFTFVWPDAPKGPTGIRNYGGTLPMWLLNALPKDGVNTENDAYKVLKFIEFMHSKDGRLLNSFGIEGVHYAVNSKGEIDRNKYPEKVKADFKNLQGGYAPFFWGYVSPFFGYLDANKYPKFEDSIKNIQFFTQVPEQPKDERYQDWVTHCQKWTTNMYPYLGYSNDDLKAVAPQVNEFVQAFYIKAIITKNFNIDSEWPKFVEDYYKNGGQKALVAFTKLAKAKNLK